MNIYCIRIVRKAWISNSVHTTRYEHVLYP